MGNMTLQQVASNALSLFTPELEGALIALALAISLMYGIVHGHYGWFYGAIAGSAALVSIVAIARTVFNVTAA